jgi:hypothetical protein
MLRRDSRHSQVQIGSRPYAGTPEKSLDSLWMVRFQYTQDKRFST